MKAPAKVLFFLQYICFEIVDIVVVVSESREGKYVYINKVVMKYKKSYNQHERSLDGVCILPVCRCYFFSLLLYDFVRLANNMNKNFF